MTQSSPPKQGGLSATTCADRAQGPAPTLIRRLAAFIYEGLILFAVLFAVSVIELLVTHLLKLSVGSNTMPAIDFPVLATYFIWFWTHGGQTLPMRAWQLRLVSSHGLPVTLKQALIRFLLSWMWFLPPTLMIWLAGWQDSPRIYGIVTLLWLGVYALLAQLHPQKQFWHDEFSGTRLIDNRTEVLPS